jgi:hypothetical protein
MRNVIIFFILLTMLSITGCGGRAAPPPKTEAPPPPIDHNLLDLTPYETDVVLWINFDKLRKSAIWTLIEEVFHNEDLKIPGEAAINPLFACHEAVLGFWESDQYGSQLVIVAKGDGATHENTIASIRQAGNAQPVEVDGFKGVKAKDFFLLALTKRTIAFGNEAIVRMAAKAAKDEGRALTDNPKYDSFSIEGNAAAKLRSYNDRDEPLVSSLKNVTPRINPNAVASIDGEFFTDSGLDIDIRVQTETQMDASVIAGDLSQTKGELSKNMVVLFLGLEWLLNRIEIATEKDVVKIDVTLDERDVVELRQLMDRLQKIRELLGNQKKKGDIKGTDEE